LLATLLYRLHCYLQLHAHFLAFTTLSFQHAFQLVLFPYQALYIQAAFIQQPLIDNTV
jgi:hypothetical protein